jgi:predicted MFS family arabinose efflux permease
MHDAQGHAGQFAARQWALLLAMCFGSTLAHIATTGMPLQVGALMDGTARTASQAGLFAFVQVSSLALGMILLSVLVARIRPTQVAVAGALLASVAYLTLYFARAFWLQLACGAVAGYGFGLVYSANIAAGASVEDADRAYGIGFGGSLLLVVSIMTVLPFMSTRFGLLGVFACLAGFSLISTPLFRGFKTDAVARQDLPPTKRQAVWRTAGAPGLLLSWAAFSAGTAMAYVFAERIGKSIHLLPTEVGLVLSSGVFVGLVGTTSAALFSQRINRRVALIVGLAGSALACLLIGHATSLVLFAAGIWLFWVFTMFLYCFLLGSAAILDKSGRLGTFGSGTERLGYAVGSWIGGLLAQHVSYSSTGTYGCAVCLIGLVLGYPTLFRALDRARSPAIGAVLSQTSI